MLSRIKRHKEIIWEDEHSNWRFKVSKGGQALVNRLYKMFIWMRIYKSLTSVQALQENSDECIFLYFPAAAACRQQQTDAAHWETTPRKPSFSNYQLIILWILIYTHTHTLSQRLGEGSLSTAGLTSQPAGRFSSTVVSSKGSHWSAPFL